MKTFKTLAAIACLATAAFGSMSAEAGMRVNGFQLNGISLNGVTLNGFQLNGISLNGVTLNGISINGTAATGVQAGTPVAVTLPEVAAR